VTRRTANVRAELLWGPDAFAITCTGLNGTGRRTVTPETVYAVGVWLTIGGKKYHKWLGSGRSFEAAFDAAQGIGQEEGWDPIIGRLP
jgi:hypothetical protein